jgi:hypothetical protein
MAKKKKRGSKMFRRPRRRETYRVDDGVGPPCPRCGKTTKRWCWPDYRARAELTGKSVYRWWFQCLNRGCKTNQIMPPEAVFDPRHPSDDDHARNLAHFREI